MTVRQAVVFGLLATSFGIIAAGGARQSRRGASLLHEANADGFTGLLGAVCLIAFGVITTPIAIVFSVGACGLGGLLPLMVLVLGFVWLRGVLRARSEVLPAEPANSAAADEIR